MMGEDHTALNVAVVLLGGVGMMLGLLFLLSSQPGAVSAAAGVGASGDDVEGMALNGDVITVCLGGGCDFDTVQAAVDAAGDGDEIRVAAGTYTGVSARAGVTQVAYISKTVTVRGGYTTTDWSVPHPMSTPTTLDAEGEGRVLYIAAGVSPTLEGLRLTGGSALGLGGGPFGYDVGGGAYLGSAAATISGCHVMSNTAVWGGGLYVEEGTAAILNNRIERNQGLRVDSVFSRGGGVYLRGGRGAVAGNIVALNRVDWDWGGGIYMYQSAASLESNRVTDNVVRIGGGGLHAFEGTPQLVDNVVSANKAEWGGGINFDNSECTISGNDVVSNTATFAGGGMCFGASSASLAGNTVLRNQARFGGAVYLNGSQFALTGNTLRANSASESGGGLYGYDATASLTNTIIVDNWSVMEGAGIQAWAASLRLVHCTLARNGLQIVGDRASVQRIQSSNGEGSGIYLRNGSSAALTNTIVAGHSVGTYGNGDTAISLHGTLWGSGQWANDSDWSGSSTINHTGDYWGDPAFVDPNAGDYRIGPSSAAIDRGVDAGVSRDMEGDPRPLPAGGGFDLGADEYAEIDLSASRKAVHPDQAMDGDVLTYTFLLLNRGNMQARDTLLVDPVPTQTTYISDSESASAGLVTAGESIRWSGTLTPHQPVTVTFSVTLEQSSVVQNTAVVTDEKGGVTALWAVVNGEHCYLPLIAR